MGVQQMEEEVKDISQEVEEESLKKKKDKEKERVRAKGKELKIKDVEEQQQKLFNVKENVNETDPSKRGGSTSKEKEKPPSSTAKGIEIDAKLAKKILTSILGSNIGKSLNAVIRKEVRQTDTAIEKIKEEMKKKG